MDVWGNAYGLLGEQTEEKVTSFVLKEEINQIEKISVNNKSVLALDKNGDLWSWGENINGQLGNGEYSSQIKTMPIKINDIKNKFKEISIGKQGSLMIDTQNILWTTGDHGTNADGSLGNSYIPTKRFK